MEYSLRTIEEIDSFIKMLAAYLNAGQVGREQSMDIALCLRESLNNAFLYGNINGEDRCVRVNYQIIDDEFSFWVYDCGEKKLKVREYTKDDLLTEHGRGLMLMQELLDELYLEKGAVGGKLTIKH